MDNVKNETVKYMKERLAFKNLLLENPNHFGTSSDKSFKSVLKIQAYAAYEKISCVGFNPDMDILEATVLINRPNGYLGDLCHAGSQEYVRFYIDYGSGWEDVGISAFNAHDIPNGRDCAKKPDKPLSYVVTHALEPRRNYCGRPMLPKVRAILSWQAAPPAGQPDWLQVWGNTVDVNIQIKPRKWQIYDILDSVGALKKIPDVLELAKFATIEVPPLPEPNVKELATLYMEKSKAAVQPKRFAMKFANMAKSAALLDASMVSNAATELKLAGINWGELLGDLEKTKGDVSFEELHCLGLDYNRDWLVASLTVKKSNGFSGGPCTAGSTEYVAFWVDWDDKCQWTYLGTSEVNVHDYADIPSGGLHYWVGLPAQLEEYRRTCKEPKIGRIRAVLSWNSPPSTTDPDDIPHWGNRLDSHVEIKPKGASLGVGLINVIGGIPVKNIDVAGNGLTASYTDGVTVYNAKFALGGTLADALNRPCPFGGRVHVQGYISDSYYLSGRKYRLVTRRNNVSPAIPVTTPFHISSFSVPSSTVTPDSDGYVPYMPASQNMFSMLGWWETGGVADELQEIRLEWVDGALNSGHTAWHRVRLNNTSPEAHIEIDNGLDCKDFAVGQPVTGKFVARHNYFGSWALRTTPASFGPPNPTPDSGNTQTGPAPGNNWTLETGKMTPCGYVVAVHVSDRTIVGSTPGWHNDNYDDTGFCLRATVFG